ncbi:MAG TPA: NADP-dependent oxidoreductase [Candidatus Saccharimonas sp.]|nr:NADP-dependent oxidoreductase [Candidatus Saccharimonas sp.]
MKAAQMNGYGDASVVQIAEVDKPVADEGKVVVEVHASSINPFDAKLRAGYMKERIPLVFPFRLGGDMAGVVVEVGAKVHDLAVGDRVYGQAAAVAGNSGAWGEYAATAAGQVAKMPAGLSFEEAAALPMVGVSALQALTEHIHLESGQKLLVLGGAGGIGMAAIEMAKHWSVYVAATASGAGMAMARTLGADEVIDYKAENGTVGLRDFDAVVDTVGGQELAKVLGVLRAGGVGVSMVGAADPAAAKELGVSVFNQSTKVTTEALDRLRELVEAGAVKPHVAKIFGLNQVAAAFEAWEAGGVGGKVVVKVR